jgi:hypothetical protein
LFNRTALPITPNASIHRDAFDEIRGVQILTPFERAQLNLQLFDLRREAVLREARAWFLAEFNPDSFADLAAMVWGERNAAFRMVLSYWEMAASLVSTGAIDGDAFRAAHGEIFATFSKIQPYLAELRSASAEPEFCKHIEAVVMAAPDAETILTRRREVIRGSVRARAMHQGQSQSAT